MKKKVLLYKTLPTEAMERLAQHAEICQFNGLDEHNKAAFFSTLADTQGLIGSSVMMGPDILDRAPQLQAVSTISVGTDQFDHDYLAKRGIALMHTPGVLDETTADTLFTLIMCTARRAVELANMVREGRWTQNIGPEHFGTDVYGKTLGIIGMGRIGYAIAKRAHLGFDMPIQYCNRSRNVDAEDHLKAVYTDMETLLKTSDFVCVMTPLTQQTQGLIGAKELAMMKANAIFINGSRGKVIDEAALIHALKEGTIRAAGLDVFEVEPLPASSPLCQLDNAVIFPHIGSATQETRDRMAHCAVDNLIKALHGDISTNCANSHLLIP